MTSKRCFQSSSHRASHWRSVSRNQRSGSRAAWQDAAQLFPVFAQADWRRQLVNQLVKQIRKLGLAFFTKHRIFVVAKSGIDFFPVRILEYLPGFGQHLLFFLDRVIAFKPGIPEHDFPKTGIFGRARKFVGRECLQHLDEENFALGVLLPQFPHQAFGFGRTREEFREQVVVFLGMMKAVKETIVATQTADRATFDMSDVFAGVETKRIVIYDLVLWGIPWAVKTRTRLTSVPQRK